MYKIVGADGKEYGPVTIDQVREWLAQGRINAHTKMQTPASLEWKPAGEIPELAFLFAPASPVPRPSGGPPPLPTVPNIRGPRQGLSVLSFVLGLCSFVLCLSGLTGIPAIICGHIARRRARRSPAQFGGAGFAMAGILLGYASLVFSLVVAGLLLPAISQARRNAQWQGRNGRWQNFNQPSDCQNNLRQIGLSFKLWALEHNDQFPFNVSTNSGGTLELCRPGPDGYDKNAIAHFAIISNELNNPGFLVCQSDRSKHPASSFDRLQAENLSYQLRTGTNINGDNPQEILVVCPIDGNELFCDGNVRKADKSRR